MKERIVLVRIGTSQRMERLLQAALEGIETENVSSIAAETMQGKRILFALAMDELGPDETFARWLRWLRGTPCGLQGSVGCILVDGGGELYTKAAAQELALAANGAGCMFPGKPLVEGTGSLYNQHIQAQCLGLTWEETYVRRSRELVERLLRFQMPRFERPRLLMLHASDQRRSNTVWLGREILRRLPEHFHVQEICLQNGAIYDCRGCSYETCLHFSKNGTCFYGGAISQEVLPAIRSCDAMLFLCPNYNDAVSANIMALFNRLTNLLVQQELLDKYLFGVVVSGYSGSDLVARQLLGAMCFNKTAMLPPHFCMMETAHDPDSARQQAGIVERLDAFAGHMVQVLQK